MIDMYENVAVRAHDEMDKPVTQSVYTMVSPAQFREALDAAIEERSLTLREAITVRRARRNPRVFDRLYGRVMQEVPTTVYAGPLGFDFQAFLDWLVENLPTILSVLASLLMFL